MTTQDQTDDKHPATHAKESTRLANAFANAGAAFLRHMGTGGALAAIPDTDPQQYVVAGTLAMIGEVLPKVESIAGQAQWISVDDDRKPEVRKPILLFVRTLTRGEDDDGRPYETEGEQVEMGEYRKMDGYDVYYFDCYTSPMSDNDWITHWMPLPKAPASSQAQASGGE